MFFHLVVITPQRIAQQSILACSAHCVYSLIMGFLLSSLEELINTVMSNGSKTGP